MEQNIMPTYDNKEHWAKGSAVKKRHIVRLYQEFLWTTEDYRS
jgi:hypothetical protein